VIPERNREQIRREYQERAYDGVSDNMEQELKRSGYLRVLGDPIAFPAELEGETLQVSDSARVDVSNGGFPADLPVLADANFPRRLFNFAVNFIGADGNSYPAYAVRFRTPNITAADRALPHLTIRGRRFDIMNLQNGRPVEVSHFHQNFTDNETLEEFINKPEFKYVLGILRETGVILRRDELSSLGDFLRQYGHHIEIEIDTYIPPQSGLGGSVKLANLLLRGVLKITGRETNLDKKQTAILASYMEAILKTRGGFNDSWQESGLRILGIAAGRPFEEIENTIRGALSAERERDLVKILADHTVYYYPGGKHQASGPLEELMKARLRGDAFARVQMRTGSEDVDALVAVLQAFNTRQIEETDLLKEIGRLAQKGYNQFGELVPSVIVPKYEEIRAILEAEKSAGNLQGEFFVKFTGAGAGSFLVIYLTNVRDKSVIEALLKDLAAKDNLLPAYKDKLVKAGVYHADLTGRTASPTFPVGLKMETFETRGARLANPAILFMTSFFKSVFSAVSALWNRAVTAVKKLFTGRSARIAEGPKALIGVSGGASAKDLEAVRNSLGTGAGLFTILAIGDDDDDEEKTAAALYERSKELGVSMGFLFDKSSLANANEARVALVALSTAVRRADASQKSLSAAEFGALARVFGSALPAGEAAVSAEAIDRALLQLVSGRSRAELLELIKNLPAPSKQELELSGRNFIILNDQRVITADDLAAVGGAIQKNLARVLIATDDASAASALADLGEWTAAIGSLDSKVGEALVTELAKDAASSNLIARHAALDTTMLDAEGLPSTGDYAIPVPYEFFEQDPIGTTMHVQNLREKHKNIHLFLTVKESKAAGLNASARALFGEADIALIGDDATASEIATIVRSKMVDKGIEIGDNHIAVLTADAINTDNAAGILVVQLDAAAKTSVGIIENTVKLLARSDRSILPHQFKGFGNYLVYLPPLVPGQYLIMIAREKVALLAVGTSA
jgi:galactokinase/mevalonate kinase-like predicted kinase